MGQSKMLLKDLHLDYIRSLDKDKDSPEYWMTEFLRISGVYWGLTAAHVLGAPDLLDSDQVLSFVHSCQVTVKKIDGIAFGGGPKHDPHLLYTLSAVQILATLDALDTVDTNKIGNYIRSLWMPEVGTFMGDEWGEVDSRFSYCALSVLSIIGELDTIDVRKAIDWVLSCQNFDGGFGNIPGSESHGGQAFCCVGALAITDSLERLDHNRIAIWLAERQLPSGGLNGRPEKLEDVCYSWWVLSSLQMLGKTHWIDKQGLIDYILKCQDDESGGISDKPGNVADVFHTVFGVAGLSMLGYPGLQPVSAAYCMPQAVIDRLKSTKKKSEST